MPLRTFLAIELDSHIVESLVSAQGQLANPADKVKWVERQNLHVTLKFLGDVSDDAVHRVCGRMAEAAAKITAFEFAVRGLVVSPRQGPIRMVWGGVDDPSGLMNVLHEQIDQSLAGMGFKEEIREFRPHITIARVKHVHNAGLFRSLVKNFEEYEFGHQHCDEVVAYTSMLTGEGPVYTPICHAPLG